MRPLLRFAASLVATMLVVPNAWAAVSACRQMTVARPPSGGEPGPVPDNPVGCRRGVSFQPEAGVTLWRCQVLPADGQDDIPEGAPEYAILVERSGQPMQALRDELMADRFASIAVLSVDLDGDGARERVLAAWNGAGMGLGVNRWTIRVFDASWTLLREFTDVAEWGETSIVAAPKGRRGCDLAITAFVESVNRRGAAGISLQARFFRLAGARMEEAADRPPIERRYDFAFQRERSRRYRGTDGLETGDIAAWLSHPSTRPSPRR